VWDDPLVGWTQADLCVVRSTWDYHKKPKRFSRWIDDTATKTQLLNPPHILQWNAHKSYLRELGHSGIAIVPTFWLSRGAAIDLGELLRRLDWPDAVIKPAYGASADGILRVSTRRYNMDRAQAYLSWLLEQQDALVL
jgi:hypothetical protein